MSTIQDERQKRWQRIEDAVALKKPDRVPFAPKIGLFPIKYAGLKVAEVYEDLSKGPAAWKKFIADFPYMDSFTGVTNLFPSATGTKRLLGYSLLQYPGLELPDWQGFQFVEKEYLTLADYPEFNLDPSGWLLRQLLPRQCENLKGLAKFPDVLNSVSRGYFTFFNNFMMAFGDDELWESLSLLRQGAKEHLAFLKVIRQFMADLGEMGYDPMAQGAGDAPFDVVSDELRGTIGAMKDTLRNPEPLLRACEIVEATQKKSLQAALKAGARRIFFPLHKGIDSFMSDSQFKKFYWPGLKALIDFTTGQGGIACVFLEESFDTRLEVMADIAAPGRVVYMLEKTDVIKARRLIGDRVCIMGGIPVSLLIAGQPAAIRDEVRRVVEGAGRDGGFILSTSANLDFCPEANVRAMYEAAEEFCGQA